MLSKHVGRIGFLPVSGGQGMRVGAWIWKDQVPEFWAREDRQPLGAVPALLVARPAWSAPSWQQDRLYHPW